jgi:hypothetical protein
MIPGFLEMLERMKEIHLKKNKDYTTDPNANPLENFDRANIIASWFPDEYKSYAVLIGVKLARLGALLSSGKTPQNEPVDDSFLDLDTYAILMYCHWVRENKTLKDCYHFRVDTTYKCIDCEKNIPPNLQYIYHFTNNIGLRCVLPDGIVNPYDSTLR